MVTTKIDEQKLSIILKVTNKMMPWSFGLLGLLIAVDCITTLIALI